MGVVSWQKQEVEFVFCAQELAHTAFFRHLHDINDIVFSGKRSDFHNNDKSASEHVLQDK